MTTLFDEVNRRNLEMKKNKQGSLGERTGLGELDLPTENELPEPMKLMNALPGWPTQEDSMRRYQDSGTEKEEKDEYGINDIPMEISSESDESVPSVPSAPSAPSAPSVENPESVEELQIESFKDELPRTTIFKLGPDTTIKKKGKKTTKGKKTREGKKKEQLSKKSSFQKKKLTKAQKKQRDTKRKKAKKELIKAKKNLTKALKRYRKVMKI